MFQFSKCKDTQEPACRVEIVYFQNFKFCSYQFALKDHVVFLWENKGAASEQCNCVYVYVQSVHI